MLRVAQTKLPQRGNSLRASVASILELNLEEVPAFEEGTSDDWINAKKWLNNNEYTFIPSRDKPPGYSIAVGYNRSSIHQRHYVVALDGELTYDPHPASLGLIKIERYWIIERVETKKEAA